MPDDTVGDDPELDLDEAPRPASPTARPRLRAKAVWIVTSGLVAAGVLFSAYKALAPGRSSSAGAMGGAIAVTIPAALEQLADSVVFAVSAFEIRARLFERQKMVCDDLARGLVELEERWIAYNAARRATAGVVEGTEALGRLQAEVGATEDRFARTGCPRP